MTFKKIIGTIHLWVGLGTGLVVFVVSITGCLYAFQKEIQDITQSYRYAKVENKSKLAPSEFVKIAHKTLPKAHLHAINYTTSGRNVEAIFFGLEPEHYYVIYLNPYSGKVIHVQNMNETFFRWVLDGHYYLWLPDNIGQPVVAYATLLFFIMLVSGIILWWPKNKAAAKQRFWFQWKSITQWKRKNYDLHNILGFYSSSILLVVAITGMVFGIQWFAYIMYKGLGGQKSVAEVYYPINSQKPITTTFNKPAIDIIYDKMQAEYPNNFGIEVHPPEADSSSILAEIRQHDDLYYSMDYRYFDQYTLREIPVQHFYGLAKNDKLPEKLYKMNYDIHTGSIFGFSGKILAFFVSLVAASLPITGFLVWWGKRTKSKANSQKNTPIKNEIISFAVKK